MFDPPILGWKIGLTKSNITQLYAVSLASEPGMLESKEQSTSSGDSYEEIISLATQRVCMLVSTLVKEGKAQISTEKHYGVFSKCLSSVELPWSKTIDELMKTFDGKLATS